MNYLYLHASDSVASSGGPAGGRRAGAAATESRGGPENREVTVLAGAALRTAARGRPRGATWTAQWSMVIYCL